MTRIDERVSTHVYKVKRISKEEMESIAGVCVYDQPPFCNAACPLKLDVKAMLKAAAENDFKKAFKIYESIAPFPLILSAGCGAPCEEKCRLCELGDGIAIGDIERAVALSGGAGEKRSIFRVRKKKKAAVFGSGLFALLLAGELEKKGYPVTAICGEADEEEYLRVAAGFLREDDFYTELKRLRGKDIAFEFNAEMTRELFEEKRGGFDVLCASEKATLDIFPGAVRDETVVLLSKGEVDSKKIRVEFSLEDMDMSEFQDGATYTQIKDYVLEHSGLKVSNLYISQIKRKCGIEVGKNYNLPKSEDSRQPQCPPEKEKAIREAMKYFGMI